MMNLQQMMLSQFNPRQVKYLTVNAIGLAGIAIAVTAVLISQDQVAALSQIGQQLLQSPIGSVITSIKSYF
jgi:hypothetical protein